jgi:phospholipase D1/2
VRHLLVPGDTCHRIARAETSGALIDARDYFRAFCRAVEQAEHSLLIAGWDLDSRLELVRGADQTGWHTPTALLPLLEWAVARRPALRCYVLVWDYSLLYALEREWMQRWKFGAGWGQGVRLVFDDRHAAGASHHQKFVVADGALAFAGGIDLCDGRWDDRRHAPDNSDRVTVYGKAHKPFHDVMGYCTGPAAAAIAELFRERWLRATGEPLALDGARPSSAPVADFDGALPIACGEVAISVTSAEHADSGAPQVEQIRRLYERAIDAARELIYIETQYFSSRALHDALRRRMRAGGALEIVIVLPDAAESPKERFVLGAAERWALSSLRLAAREHGHALHVVCSESTGADGQHVPTYVHAKVLVVDDRLLSIGSANCTNRSMSLDTELNLTWACDAADDPLSASITRLRASLLCEHAGIAYDPTLERRRGLGGRLTELLDGSRLRERELPEQPADVERDPLLERTFDPSRALTEFELDDVFERRHD